MRTFRGGLLIGLAVAVLVAAAAITYERYDTRTLKRSFAWVLYALAAYMLWHALGNAAM